MTVASAEEDGPKDSATTTEVLADDEEYMTRPRDHIQQRRQLGLDDGPKVYRTTMEASAENDQHKDYNNYN